ncbi:PAS domain-containing protein [Aromatoleum toluvorans]|uniref:PAS domain-containing protein n=1 Tax=Aromatoleum toluvorans TaxID=92002 RepID=UPI001FE35276|nr:PAS domain-containing protein [Aromatoleum toluvorans]
MLSLWLYLIGAATACAYALGASMAWIPASPALAVVSLTIASVLILAAELCHRRALAQAAGRTPVSPPPLAQDDHSLVDGIDDIVFQTDTEATLTFLNRSWKDVTALDARDCVGHSFFDYVHPDDQALNREQLLKVLQPGQAACRFETRLICRDGRQCWVDVRLKPRRGRHGEFNGATGIMTDINSRKRAEEVLRARDRSLSTLLDHLPGMAFRCRNDRSWTMEFVSEGCFELTGHEAVDLLDHHASYDQLIHPADRSYVWDYVQSQLARRNAFHLRYRIRTREGRERWVEERSRGVFAGNGTLLAIEGFISDISDQMCDQGRAAREC